MFSQPTIMKFGGTSVEDASGFERVCGIVCAQAGACSTVVVVSAMSRVTDALLSSVKKAAEGQEDAASHLLSEHFERHSQVARALLGLEERATFEAELSESRGEIERLLRTVAQESVRRPVDNVAVCQLQDEVVSHGERMSASLLARLLRARGLAARYVDARRCIVTNDEHGNAVPLIEETRGSTRRELEPLLEAREVPVLGGFIAASLSGETTTLGRGGSDYSAALIGAALSATEIQIWTDVTGVLTADPRLVQTARTIPRLSYSEAAELAYFGAKVLHPKTIQPAIEKSIPVRICNSRAPEEAGTIVHTEAASSPRTVKAIAHKTGVTSVQVTAAQMLGAYGFLSALFKVFDRHRTVVDVVTTSEVSVSLTLDDASALPLILPELRELGEVEVETRRAIICIVGEGLRSTPGIAARVFSTIQDINVSLISQGASRINLTFVIDEARVRDAAERLHAAFFSEAEESRLSASELQFRASALDQQT
ncbi:MAG TPA: lysine-sensitive aspartokinase 3 [Pyrinomonadaceae bacterium]|jgi:aspartate kinase